MTLTPEDAVSAAPTDGTFVTVRRSLNQHRQAMAQMFQYQSMAVRKAPSHALKSPLMGWLTDDMVWWRHPIARIFVLVLILTLDMWMYSEDPLNDSHVEYNVPGMNHALGLLAFWIAPTAGLAFVKAMFILYALISGVFIGRNLVGHRLCRDCCHFSAFEGSEGSLGCAVMFFFVMLAVFAYVYNAVAAGSDEIGPTQIDLFFIFGARSREYRHVNQVWQCLSVSLDMLSIVMISDSIFQDRDRYPEWADRFKRFWCHTCNGYFRAVGCWVIFFSCSVGIGWSIQNTGKGPEHIQGPVVLGGTSDVTRGFVSAMMVFTDLTACIQDWDFPTFREPLEMEFRPFIMGTFSTKLSITWVKRLVAMIPSCPGMPDCLRRWMPAPDFFHLTISGKWLQYGPLIGVMLVDLLYTKTQVLYTPAPFGQYTDPHTDRIWAITDTSYLAQAFTDGVLLNASLITYEARRNVTTGLPLDASAETDFELNARYMGKSSKYFGVLLGVSFLVLFSCMLKSADWKRAAELEEMVNNATNMTVGASQTDATETTVYGAVTDTTLASDATQDKGNPAEAKASEQDGPLPHDDGPLEAKKSLQPESKLMTGVSSLVSI